MEMKWYNVELPMETAGRFKEYCRDFHLRHETSECGDLVHFEVFCNAIEAADANRFLATNC